MRIFINDRIIAKLSAFIAVLLCAGLTVLSDIKPLMASEGVGFSVKAIHSNKQTDEYISYFDLMLSPNEEHVLEIDIFNNDENPIVVSITACTAGTNPSGVIEYDNINVTDDSLQVSFADIATIDESLICIPAAEVSRARINIKMPDILFDGIMLGGIAIKKVETPDAGLSEGGTSILNEYCYVIAAKIGVSETTVEPEFRLRSVEPALSNHHTNIAANLQNYQAAIAKGIEIDASVYYNNNPTPLYSNSSADFDVAPNSNFDYFIPCSGKLSAGDYRLLLTAAHGNQTWEFDETFSVTESAANDINERAVNVPSINYYFIATIFLSLLLIILLAVIIWMKIAKKKTRADKER